MSDKDPPVRCDQRHVRVNAAALRFTLGVIHG